MTTTIGLFHPDFANPQAGFRAGKMALSTPQNVVPVVLPALVASRAAVAALTKPEPHESLLKAVLAQGWQDVNLLFENGAWYELTDVLGTRGRQLAPAVDEPEPEEIKEVEYATDRQLKKLHDVTSSGVFDCDREALRLAADNGTIEQVSEILDYVFREVKSRKEAEKQSGGR